MNPYQADLLSPKPDTEQWSNRVLIAAMAGILFLTLFPFRLMTHAQLPAGVSPFSLCHGFGKQGGAKDIFLNVLLFVPFGFALADKLLARRKPRATAFLITWIAGAVFSYAIEFTQLYVPGRDSGWEDVVTNSTGAAVGFLLFVALGGALLAYATQIERATEAFLTAGRLAVVLSVYFALWFAASAHLQTKTRLADWDPGSRLYVGNMANGRPATAWKGAISKIEFWDRPLSRQTAIALTSGSGAAAAPPPALADYDLSGAAPFRDRSNSLPDLSWSNPTAMSADPGELVLNGSDWLASAAPPSALIAQVERTSRFALHIVCTPAQDERAGAEILSIARSPYFPDMTLRQEDRSLVFWFRTPLSARHAQISWSIPRIFAANQSRNILYSYDGSVLSLYIDGRLAASRFRLGPGAALAHFVRWLRPAELDGYLDIFYALVFVPAGVLLGIAARKRRHRPALWLVLALLFVLPPLLFEALLVAVSGRFFSRGEAALSFLLLIAAALWINADPSPRSAAPAAPAAP
ncbi:MAG TPA: VanZ family protein [Candidatus Aquilonibacter sp.]|nr:VanZ family protein [Candidatus Aquilonibacter sp.]